MKTLIIAAAISLFAGSVAANPFIDNPDIWPGASDDAQEVNLSGVDLAGSGTYTRVSDNDIYRGFEVNNLELSTSYGDIGSLGMQPGMGDSFGMGSTRTVTTDNDIYHGFEIDNLEL